MTIMIKQIMQDYYVVNEAELFCSDLEFKVNDEKITKKLIGDNTKQNEDVKLCCNDRIQDMIKKFRIVAEELVKRIEQDSSKNSTERAKKILAYTVYFATYFHPQ